MLSLFCMFSYFIGFYPWIYYLFIIYLFISIYSFYLFIYLLCNRGVYFRLKPLMNYFITHLWCPEELGFCILLIRQLQNFSASSNGLFSRLAYASLSAAPIPPLTISVPQGVFPSPWWIFIDQSRLILLSHLSLSL